MDEEQGLIAVLSALQSASKGIATSSWSTHDRIINSIMDATSLFYLRTSPQTGDVSPTTIWPTFDQPPTLNLGCFGATVRPLVVELERVMGVLIPELVSRAVVDKGATQDLNDGINMRDRIVGYRAVLDSVDPLVASAVVWEQVTMPLLLGYYQPGTPGIINPAVKSSPDVVRPYTLAFQIALHIETKKHAFEQLFRDLATNAKNVVLAIPRAIEAVAKESGRGMARGVGMVLGLGVGLYLLSGKRR